jgi:hypothetical protein
MHLIKARYDFTDSRQRSKLAYITNIHTLYVYLLTSGKIKFCYGGVQYMSVTAGEAELFFSGKV